MSIAQATRAVFQSPDLPLRLDTVSLPVPRDGDAIVQVELCTICGSDLHTIEGRRSASGEQVLGHEIIGNIASLSESGTLCDIHGDPLRVGDRVTWSLHASCGACFWCEHRLSQKCERLFKYGHAPITDEYPVTGGMATHCQLRAGTAIVRLPEEMDSRLVCPANCATATVAAAFRQANVDRDACIVILGAGMLGLTAAAWAREQHAGDVVVLDPNPQRGELAWRFGATAVCTDAIAAKDLLLAATSNRGADMAFDFSGNSGAVEASLELVRIGGHVVWVGSVFPGGSITVSPESVVRRCLQIVGVHNYLAEDLVAAISFLKQYEQAYPFADLVSATFGLSEVDQAIQFASTGKAVRVGVRPKL